MDEKIVRTELEKELTAEAEAPVEEAILETQENAEKLTEEDYAALFADAASEEGDTESVAQPEEAPAEEAEKLSEEDYAALFANVPAEESETPEALEEDAPSEPEEPAEEIADDAAEVVADDDDDESAHACTPNLDEPEEDADVEEVEAPAEAIEEDVPAEAEESAEEADDDESAHACTPNLDEPEDEEAEAIDAGSDDEPADEASAEAEEAASEATGEADDENAHACTPNLDEPEDEEELSEEALAAAAAAAPLALEGESSEAAEAQPAPAPVAPKPGIAAMFFNGLSCIGLPVLLVMALAMTFMEVWFVRDLWFSEEARLADVFMNVKAGDWLVLMQNGQPYPDNPPFYFWFMEALTRIPSFTVPTFGLLEAPEITISITMPMVMFLAVALSHALFIGSIWMLARATGHNRRESFAAGLVTLCCTYISGLACIPGMHLLFGAVVALGMACLYRGWIKRFAPFWLALGFLLAGAATLVESALGMAFAIVTSFFFLFWRGTPGRLNGRDGLPGFLLMLLGVGGWLGYLYLTGHQDYLHDIVMTQLINPVMGEGQGLVWWYYLAALPIIWLPFTLLVLFVNWFAVLGGIPTLWRERKTNGGSSWLWIWLATGVAMLSFMGAKTAFYAVPLLAPLAVLTGRSIIRLTPGRSRGFFALTALVLALSGLALVLFDVWPTIGGYIPADWKALALAYLPAEWQACIPAMLQPLVAALDGTMYMGAALVLTAVILLFLTRRALPGGALLVMTIGMIGMFLTFQAMVVPSLDAMFSQSAQAEAKVEQTAAPAPAAPAAVEMKAEQSAPAAPEAKPEA